MSRISSRDLQLSSHNSSPRDTRLIPNKLRDKPPSPASPGTVHTRLCPSLRPSQASAPSNTMLSFDCHTPCMSPLASVYSEGGTRAFEHRRTRFHSRVGRMSTAGPAPSPFTTRPSLAQAPAQFLRALFALRALGLRNYAPRECRLSRRNSDFFRSATRPPPPPDRIPLNPAPALISTAALISTGDPTFYYRDFRTPSFLLETLISTGAPPYLPTDPQSGRSPLFHPQSDPRTYNLRVTTGRSPPFPPCLRP
jgi:hypothetical protein